MSKNKLTRRQFVSTVTAGAGTVIIGNTFPAAEQRPSTSLSDNPKVVSLGNSGLKTTFLGMGTGFSGCNSSSGITGPGLTGNIFRTAYEKGIRFFDCADSYGTHSGLAAALRSVPRENFTICSKIWVSQGGIPEPGRPDADVVIDRFRKELNTDYIDLIQMHCMTDAHWTDKEKRQMDILEKLKSKNIIRAHGVSVHSLEAMEACSGNPWVDVVHVRINPYGEAMDRNDPAQVTPVIEKLHREGKGIIGMKLTGAGKFRYEDEKIDESLKYVIGLSTVDMIIVGFEKPEQIDSYLARVKNVLKQA
jgi:aryl-alcohol dehydrogenase-like predicted oxidoreductase